MHFFLQDYEKSLEWQDSSYKAAMYQDYFPDQSQRYSACFYYDGQQILMTEQTYLLNRNRDHKQFHYMAQSFPQSVLQDSLGYKTHHLLLFLLLHRPEENIHKHDQSNLLPENAFR